MLYLFPTNFFCVFLPCLAKTTPCHTGSWFVISTPDLSIALFRISTIIELLNPRLHAHYMAHGVDIGTTVCHKWIVTMFIDPFHSISPEFAYRILDMFFVHGPNFLVRLSAALVLFKPYAGGVPD